MILFAKHVIIFQNIFICRTELNRVLTHECNIHIVKKTYLKKMLLKIRIITTENILLKTMFELPDMEDVVKVTIDKSSVKGNSEPIITYGKKQSTSVA